MGLVSKNPKALVRIVVLTALANFGALCWGFDSGVTGTVLALQSFQNDFGLAGASDARTATIQSNVVSILQAGGFFGSIFMSFISDRLGRRKSLLTAAIVFLVGAVMQTAGTGGLGLFYGGRVLSGLGVGAATVVIPTWVSEMSPKEIRGKMMTLWQFSIVTGVTISYWLGYGVQLHVSGESSSQWQIPIGVQIIPGGILAIACLLLSESPRWLAKKGKDEQAIKALAYMRARPIDDPEVQGEFAEIHQGIVSEAEGTHGVKFKECLLPGNRHRIILGNVLLLCQQFSGTNAIGYFAPQIFATVGLSQASTGLFATGIYGVVKMVVTMCLCLFGIERFGRKMPLIVGGFFMGVFMFIIGALLRTHPPDPSDTAVSSASIGMVVCIYLYVSVYSFSWGPVCWVVASEMFPNRIREYCIASCAASQWLWNFVVTQFSPHALNTMGYGLFFLFGAFNLCNCIFAFFLKETKGRSLESMDELFHVRTAIDTEQVHKEGAEYGHDKSNVHHLEQIPSK